MFICIKCGTTDESCFSNSRKRRIGKHQYKVDYKTYCKSCQRQYDKERKEKIKNFDDMTKEIICSKCGFKGNNSSGVFHPNRYAVAKTMCICKKCRRSDPRHKVRSNQAKRLKQALKRYFTGYKSIRTMKVIGCNPEELVKYIESKFQEGMMWDNYGQWHIDHIKPLKAFDLSKEEEIIQCFHFSNLQPLWAVDNLKKSGSF